MSATDQQIKGNTWQPRPRPAPARRTKQNRLISSEKVDGTAVYNRNGDRLGTVDHLMINKFSGQVEYAVMSFGGFLGIGESYNPVPWDSLTYDVNLGGYVMDADRARVEQAPRFHSSAPPNCRIGATRSGWTSTGALVASDRGLLPQGPGVGFCAPGLPIRRRGANLWTTRRH